MSVSNTPKPPMPPQPPTLKLSETEIQKELLNKMLRTMQDGFARQETRADSQDERLDKIEKQVEIAVQDGKDNNQRITRLEIKFEEEQKRAETTSIWKKTASQVDAQHDAAIGELVTKVTSIEVNQVAAAEERASTAKLVQEIRDTVVGVATNKKVIFVGKVLFGLAVAYSAAHGLKVVP